MRYRGTRQLMPPLIITLATLLGALDVSAGVVEQIPPWDGQLEMPNATWTLNLSPIDGWDDPLGFGVRIGMGLFLGLLFSLLLATLAKLLANARTQKARLAMKVAERTAKLRARAADLERAEEIAQVGSWDFDIQSNWATTSAVASQIIGVPPDTPVSLDAILERVHPLDRATVETAWQMALRGEPYDVEHRTLVDGKQRWLRQRAVLEFDSDGRALRAVGTVEDITERKSVEEVLERERRLLEQAEQIANIGSWEWDVAEDRWTHSAGWKTIHGIDEQVPQSSEEMMTLVPIADRDAVQGALNAALDGHDSYDIEHQIIRPVDGVVRQVHAVGEVIRNNQGEILTVRGIAQDITARKEAEAELRIAAIAFEAQEGMLVTDAHEHILRVNAAFTRSTGYTAEECVGKTPRLLCSARHDPDFFAQMWARIEHQGHWEGEIWNRRKNGETFPEWLTVTEVRDDLGLVTHYVGTLTDISQRKADEAAIRRLAFYDPLTGLANRRLLLERLNQTLAAAARTGKHGALIFIDLDHFKQLNDTRGHQIGDLLLEEVARRLNLTVRESDSVARLGGDEFVVLLHDLGADPAQAAAQAEGIGEKIVAALGMPYLLAGTEYNSTPSLGIAMFDHEPPTTQDILKHADLAMYQAKSAGRNRLHFYEPRMQASVNPTLRA